MVASASWVEAPEGARILVGSYDTRLYCFDAATGRVRWRRQLVDEGLAELPQWGFAASPIIHDGRVVLQVDIHDGPYLAAWDLLTGEQLWRTERPDVAPSWATPAISSVSFSGWTR